MMKNFYDDVWVPYHKSYNARIDNLINYRIYISNREFELKQTTLSESEKEIVRQDKENFEAVLKQMEERESMYIEFIATVRGNLYITNADICKLLKIQTQQTWTWYTEEHGNKIHFGFKSEAGEKADYSIPAPSDGKTNHLMLSLTGINWFETYLSIHFDKNNKLKYNLNLSNREIDVEPVVQDAIRYLLKKTKVDLQHPEKMRFNLIHDEPAKITYKKGERTK